MKRMLGAAGAFTLLLTGGLVAGEAIAADQPIVALLMGLALSFPLATAPTG